MKNDLKKIKNSSVHVFDNPFCLTQVNSNLAPFKNYSKCLIWIGLV